jgi:hypothetical protein
MEMRGPREHTSASRRCRSIGLATLLLIASVPSCFLPELVVDGQTDEGTDSSGGSNLGGADTGGTDTGGTDTGGTDTGGTESSSGSGGSDGSGGGDPTGGSGSGGTGTGGDGSGGDGSGGGGPTPGFYESGSWHGRVSTFTNQASIDPANFDDTMDAPFCMSGAVAPQEDSSGIAGFSWYLDQAATCTGAGCVPVASTATPQEDGVALRIDNPGGSALRIEVLGPDGDDDPNDRWCVDLGAVNGLIHVPWADFNTVCWPGGTGNAYASEEIERLRIVVPGLGAGAGNVPFDFCIEIIGESSAPGGGCATADAPGLRTFSLSGSETTSVTRNAWPYTVSGDLWGRDGDQVLEGRGTSFEIMSSTLTVYGNYPATFVGFVEGLNSGTSWLPRDPWEFVPISTRVVWSGQLEAGEAALYEMRLGAALDDPDPATEVMQLWLGSDGGPTGDQVASFASAANGTWTVYADVIAGVPTAAFVPSAPITTFSDSVSQYLGHAVSEGALEGAGVIAGISFGFRLPAGGGVGLRIEDFCTAQPP